MRRVLPVVAIIAGCLASPAALARGSATVNDITRINPIVVDQVLEPTSIDEIVEAVRSHPGPVSIGGGRYSMGGQTATESALQLDMRHFDKVVAFSKERKEITVQTGITWRKIQEFIDPHELSLQIMQTYANFTVGGSLSVNVHGRYIGQGPLVHAVRSIRIVLADGTLVAASPSENPEVFYGAIGGYGSLGVIVEATLGLADNVRVVRRSEVMPLAAYPRFFVEHVRDDPDIVFHNADIYPNAFDTVRVTSYVRTEAPVSVPDRLMPKDKSYWIDRMAFRIMSEWPGGKTFRRYVLDPIVFRGERIEWRNYEASYDVRELEPVSRRASTYVLQEYFVPVENLLQFVPKMAEILNRHGVNTINVSIRHAKPDPGTLLAWARSEVFAFVLYYKQGTSAIDRKEVGAWTRELIDAATGLGGAYYLPYQILATESQFHAAYPKADALFALKRRLDPTGKFRNKLWDAYYEPGAAHDLPTSSDPVPAPATDAPPISPVDPEASRVIRATLSGVKGYARDEAQTFLTLPEWLLVYYPAEYAQSLRSKPPSAFPYFRSIGQFWTYYWEAYARTRETYPFNGRYHLMVSVIGGSYTIENVLKGAYECTIGAVSEWTATDALTQEDAYAAEVAQDYVDFIRVDPWYEFSFLRALTGLWAETEFFGPNLVRKWERKAVLSLEYLVKAQYAMLIKVATKTAYGDADAEMLTLAENVTADALGEQPKAKVLKTFDDGSVLLSLPRYEAFRDSVTDLAGKGVRFREIAGNDEILLTCVVPAAWTNHLSSGSVVFEKPLVTDRNVKRVGLLVPVPALHQVVLQLAGSGIDIEHIYDY